MLSWITDPSGSDLTGRAVSTARPDSFASPLLASALALVLLAFACEAQGAQAPVEERPLPPLLTPPGALADPAPGESPADDPLVSDFEEPADTPPGAARPGETTFRQPTFASPRAAAAAPAVRGDVAADAAGVLFSQLQDLQQEVMALRGLVEAQQNRIDRLEREQRDRYLDLDRRLSLAGTATAPTTPGQGPLVTDGGMGVPLVTDPVTGEPVETGPLDERSAYERAFALTREKRFEEAIPAFRRVIDDYPGGQYVPNAWYWLGELYLALPEPDLELARQSFVQVVQLWPDNRKVPDARYKLGVVYDRLGEPEQARAYLEQVVREHADSPAARLASSYLDQLGG